MPDLSALEQMYGLPNGLLSSVQSAESGGNPNAVSPKGALGLYQFLPSTAAQYGIDPLDPEQAATGAARMYSDLLDKYNGDVPSALAAYNWGQGSVDRKGLPNAPEETKNYISKVMTAMNGVPDQSGRTAPQGYPQPTPLPWTPPGGVQPEQQASNGIMNAIGNLIVPSAQAAEMPDLSHLSDDQLQQIVNSKPTQQVPDLSTLSDEQLNILASGKPILPSYNNKSALEDAVAGIGMGAQAGLEGFGSLYDVASLPFNALGAKIPSAADIIRSNSPFPAPENLPSDLTRGTTSALASLATGTGLESSGAPLAQKVGQALTESPLGQIASFAGADAASGAAKRAGAGDVGQIGAALVGGTPGAIASDVPALMKAAPAVGRSLSTLGDAATSLVADDMAKEVKKIPATAQDLKTLAQQSYAEADQKGGVLTPKFTDDFVNEAEKVAPQTEAGKIVSGDNAVTQLVARMQALRGKPISLSGAQEIDESLGNLIDKEYGLKGLSKEGKGLYDLQTKFRSMIDDAAQNNQIAGGKEGFDAWKQGQQYWSQMMAMKDIERIMSRASQMEVPATGVRTGMRTLANNPTRMRGFTPPEQKAIKNAAQTGALTGILKIFGSRLIPIGAATAEGVGGGGLTGGLIAGTVAHGLSSAARAGATKLQMNRAQNVLDTIASRPPKTR